MLEWVSVKWLIKQKQSSENGQEMSEKAAIV